jgi:hypothetical protein
MKKRQLVRLLIDYLLRAVAYVILLSAATASVIALFIWSFVLSGRDVLSHHKARLLHYPEYYWAWFKDRYVTRPPPPQHALSNTKNTPT